MSFTFIVLSGRKQTCFVDSTSSDIRKLISNAAPESAQTVSKILLSTPKAKFNEGVIK